MMLNFLLQPTPTPTHKNLQTTQQSPEDLVEYCKEHVAAYKVPPYFLYFDELTYNRNNKVFNNFFFFSFFIFYFLFFILIFGS